MKHNVSQHGLIIVGNMLGANAGVRPVGEDLAAGLRNRDWHVFLTASCHTQSHRLAKMVWDILRLRKYYDVALIDVFSGKAFIWAEVISTILSVLRKPMIFTLHGGRLPAFGRRFPSRVRRVLDRASVVTAPSTFLMEEMQAFRRDIQVVPNPVELSAFNRRVRRCASPTLIWVRSFHSIYEPELAPQVIALLMQEFPNIRLIMLGRDKGDGSRQRTEATAAQLGVLSMINFVGGVEKHEVPAWLDRGDIFINTTRIDNAPVSIVEAMACGLCIVSTNAGGLSHLISNEVDGLLVKVGDPKAMAEAVRRILRNATLAQLLSVSALSKVARFDSASVFTKWVELLNRVTTQDG